MVEPLSRPPLSRNPVSLAGAWLTTLAGFAFVGYLLAAWLDLFVSPYADLLGFVAIPAVFMLGLATIPIGIWREARRRRHGHTAWRWPAIDLGLRRTRLIISVLTLLTIVNITLIAVAGFGATHYMESTQFCGQACHGPMKPEATAHKAYAHANVGCVSCHVGPGAGGMVRAKMNGTRQLYLLMTGNYARPIPVPAHGLPDAEGTCVRCHTPGFESRDLLKVRREYADDETGTETVNETLLYMAKNHWHARADIRVEFVATDPIRETIPYVKLTDANGQVTEYFAPKVQTVPQGAMRRMDCLDCHSRPAHTFAPSADAAVDAAIAAGQLPRTLPFIRRETVAALKASYPDDAAAQTGIRKHLTEFYAARGAAPTEVSRAIEAATRIYSTNVFPQMKITWGTYLSQMGHSQMTGCFRCHDDEHKSRDGTRVIKQDCGLCHKEQ